MTNPFGCGPNPCRWTCREVEVPPAEPCDACLIGTTPVVQQAYVPWRTGGFCDNNCAQIETIDMEQVPEESPCVWRASGIFQCVANDASYFYRLAISQFVSGEFWKYSLLILLESPNQDDITFVRYAAKRDCTKELLMPYATYIGVGACFYPALVTLNLGNKDTDPCDVCVPEPATVPIRFNSFSDGSCNCSTLNGASMNLGINQRCEWIGESLTVSCSGADIPLGALLMRTDTGRWIVQMYIRNNYTAVYVTGVTANCTEEATATFVEDSGTLACTNGFGSSITINPGA